jgi:ATPase subunit of ABC transporter with duplicated ATPase domains
MLVALFRRPDILILDEPTNHLDKETVSALCEAISSYEGTIIAVSHDEGFVNRVIGSDTRSSQSQGKPSEVDYLIYIYFFSF